MRIAFRLALVCTFSVTLLSCDAGTGGNAGDILAKPKDFVGSDRCRECHLEHYDAWRKTPHSLATQDTRENPDAILTVFDRHRIAEDLKRKESKALPADKIHVPAIKDILYTNGSRWKQSYIIRKEGVLYVAPLQYDIKARRWLSYNESSWDRESWILKCAGCHATGVDPEANSFAESGVSCESCHGRGSQHAALPKTAALEKRQTIINPAKLPIGTAAQVCGSCHSRGRSILSPQAAWPVNYSPGKLLDAYYHTDSYADADVKKAYAEAFAKGHHQQYTDWHISIHAKEGVTCTSCHDVHRLGTPPTKSGSQQCFGCHVLLNRSGGHAIHSFANCVGCHMPRVVKSAESGITHSHVFKALIPQDTIENPVIPNSCTACHNHRNADLAELQEAAFPEWE